MKRKYYIEYDRADPPSEGDMLVWDGSNSEWRKSNHFRIIADANTWELQLRDTSMSPAGDWETVLRINRATGIIQGYDFKANEDL